MTRANERLLKVPDTETANDMLVHPIDNLVEDVAIIPIVNRSVGSYALYNRIRNENLANGQSFMLPFSNIANWNLNEEFEPIG